MHTKLPKNLLNTTGTAVRTCCSWQGKVRSKLLQACLLAVFTLLHLQPAAATEVKEFIELYKLAKAKDPVLGRAVARLEAGKADESIAFAALMPKISASASQRQLWHTVENYGPSKMDGSYDSFAYGVGGQLPIINLPAHLQFYAAEAGVKSAEHGTSLAQQDLIVRVVNAYIAMLKAQTDEKLHKDELARFGEILKQAEAFLRAGTGDVIAVYEARARMDGAAADLIKAEAQRKVAAEELTTLTGIEVDFVKDLPVIIPRHPTPDDLAWWQSTMQTRNPAIKQAQEELVQAERQSGANRAGHLPTVQLSGGYAVDKGSTFLPEVETKQWYVGISANLPIFSGGETMARTRRAVAMESERRHMLTETRDKNSRRLKEAFMNLQYNISLVEALKRKLESAELQLNATRKGREIGTRTAIDLLNAEQTWAVSRRDLNNALYDHLLRHLQLQEAAGTLSEADLYDSHRFSVSDSG